MKRLLLFTFCVLAFPVVASHIVGGEFEIVYVSGNTYRINLIIYFDKINGSPGARDEEVIARIFRKRDNAFMMDVRLSRTSEEPVSYTQPECSNGEIQTSKLIYSNLVSLLPHQFDDMEGYYIVWERCCRNYTITNIISREPPAGVINYADAAGQTFYLEFPPVMKNGKPFINSTPRLFPPLNDYACPARPYYADFAGVDDDGDSLVYSLVTPLNTHTAQALPAGGPSPAPFPEVRWQSGFSLDRIVKGNPDLRISRDGMLTVTPGIQGLFVFAVKCEEFRDGTKIGEVRRDFQMLVVDRCPDADPPAIAGKRKNDTAFSPVGQPLNVSFDHTADDAERCIVIRVTDPDALEADDNYEERIRIKVIPIGFRKDLSGLLPSVQSATLTPSQPATEFEICFEACPYIKGPYQVAVVAYDDACTLPLSDTLKVNVNVTPPPNNQPQFTTANIDETLSEDASKSWTIEGLDVDGDDLVMSVLTDGFDLADYGMSIEQRVNTGGNYIALFHWNTNCTQYNFAEKSEFEIRLLLDDIDQCNIADPDILVLKLKVDIPLNQDPIIDTNLTPQSSEAVVYLTRELNDDLIFNVTGEDSDNDFISLSVKGKDFDISAFDISFPEVSGYGKAVSIFQWNIDCQSVNLSVKDEYIFQFAVVDSLNRCRFRKIDTVNVVVKLEPPANIPPELTATDLMENVTIRDTTTIAITVGQEIRLGLTGMDHDNDPQDHLTLDLIKAEGNVEPEGYGFVPVEGYGKVQTAFTWLPDCSIFRDEVYENQYRFTFRVQDDRCFNAKEDTVAVAITVKDVEHREEQFLPPNFISPNGDGANDFFAIVKMDPQSGELVNILPPDNCLGRFEGVVIYNRWGRSIFQSPDRDFRWFAPDAAAGQYYYLLKYSHKEYKGWVTVAYGDSQSNR